jgi:hypothetical protein
MFYWFIIDILPWIISVVTGLATYLQGNKHKHGWLLAIGSQFLWAIWIIVSANYGFLPLHILLWFLYIRNHYRWQGDK